MAITTYYDPIYDQNVAPSHQLKSEVFIARNRLGGIDLAADTHIDEAIGELLQLNMFDRLSHLFQSGVAWLVFPSATHTRFCHTLGCFHLGNKALESIKIFQEGYQRDNNQWLLRDWVKMKLPEDRPKKENYFFKALFLVSLLCHDAGHFPHSHTLELNHEIDLPCNHEQHFFNLLHLEKKNFLNYLN